MKNATIKKEFIKYVSLNILGMIGLSCYILADTFFIAQGIGINGLAALNIALPAYSFIHGTGLMIGIGGSTRYSISSCKNVFTQSIFATMFSAFVFLTIGCFFSNELATILGAKLDTIENTTHYLRIICCFSPMFLLNNVITCFVRNDGNPKLAMSAMLIGSFSNIILDYILIFPLQMGMIGAALATGLAPVIGLCILSIHFIKNKNTFKLDKDTPKISSILDISSLGISSLITEFSTGIVIIVFNILILNLAGNIGVAAYGIVTNIALVIVAIFSGIAQGIQPIISRYFGQNSHSEIKRILKYAIITSTVLSLFVYITSVVYSQPIIAAFNKETNVELFYIAKNGILIYFSSFLFVGVNIITAMYFSSIAKAKHAFFISILRGFLLIIPSAIILSSFFGLNGVWLAMPFTELSVFILAFFMLKHSI